MKKLLTFALLAALVLAGCKKDDPAPDPDPAPAPLTITAHPANQEVTVGGVPATFTVAATGGKTPYTYLWEWFTTGSWNGINDNTAMWSGRTTPTLTVNALSMFNSDQFRCTVKDANNARVISNAATLTVTAAPLTIATHPANQNVAAGTTNVSFTVAASGGKAPYSYQWQYKTTTGTTWNNSNSSGNKTATLTIASATTGMNGRQYHCIVTDADGATVTSNAATLTVTNVPVTSITIAPDTEVSVEIGETTNLTATVEPVNATNKTVTWISNNPSLATVNSTTGAVTGVTAGDVAITATAVDGSGVQQTKIITVIAKVVPLTGIKYYIGGSTLPATGGEIPAGLGKFLAVFFSPITAADKRVTWTSSHPSIVTFSDGASGISYDADNYNTNLINVSPTATPGTEVTVRVTSVANSSVTYACTFTVTAAVPRTVAVGVITAGMLTAGTYESVYYKLTATGIAAGNHVSTATLQNAPPGIVISSASLNSSGLGSLILVGDRTQQAGVWNNVRLTIDGVPSNVFTIQVMP